MGNITFVFFRLFLAVLSFANTSYGLSFERLLCGNSETELNCTVGSSIDDINITFHAVQDACSLMDDAYIETKVVLDSTSYESCIGQNSCVLTDKQMNMSNSVADKTWKLLINYNCYRASEKDRNPKNPQNVCPFELDSVSCGGEHRKIEIKSVELMPYFLLCEHNLNYSCIDFIDKKVNTSCNGKRKCEPLIWNQSVCARDECFRIPKCYNIVFTCIKAIPTVLPLQAESNIEGVAVGVTVGLIIIVGVVVVYMWFVRRKSRDDKHTIANCHDKNDDYIGNQNTAMPAKRNSEMSTNFELRNINHKETNEGKTDNDLESNSETRVSGQILRPYSNSTIYSTALEPSDGGCPVNPVNAYNYEMAKPINNSKYDKNTPTLEKDNYAFNEDQYDVSGQHDGSDYPQGIYSRGVDTVYDSATHSRQNNMADETYDHAFGQTTEDDYNIAKH